MSEWVQEFSCSLPAAPAQVFAALTEPEALRQWFAEHAEVEPRAGGAYRFWGRYSYGTTSPGEATQTLTVFEPPHRFGFRWRLHGQDSEVSIAVAPDEDENNRDGTKITVTHRFPEAPAIGRVHELIDDLWRYHIGNLRAYLTGGEGIVRTDFTDPDPQVRASILIEAPVARVFASFLDPAMLNRWIASGAEVEPRVGGRYSYGWNYTIGDREVAGGPTRILELVENEKLVTDWPDWRGDPDVPVQRITWLFEPAGEHTRVTVVHEGFVRAVDVSDYPFGWPFFLSMLKPVFDPAAEGQ